MNRSLVTTMIILILQFFFIFSCETFTSKRQLWLYLEMDFECSLFFTPIAERARFNTYVWQTGVAKMVLFDHRRTG